MSFNVFGDFNKSGSNSNHYKNLNKFRVQIKIYKSFRIAFRFILNYKKFLTVKFKANMFSCFSFPGVLMKYMAQYLVLCRVYPLVTECMHVPFIQIYNRNWYSFNMLQIKLWLSVWLYENWKLNY